MSVYTIGGVGNRASEGQAAGVYVKDKKTYSSRSWLIAEVFIFSDGVPDIDISELNPLSVSSRIPSISGTGGLV